MSSAEDSLAQVHELGYTMVAISDKLEQLASAMAMMRVVTDFLDDIGD